MSERTPQRDETPAERLDRNLDELLGELRVVVTGVQVLFAFLLVVPFDARFATVDSFERAVYFTTLVLTALSGALVIAPAAHHRLLFRLGEKGELVRASQRYTVAGLVVMAAAMCGVLTLVSSVLFGHGVAILVLGAAAAVFGGLWFAIPLRLRRRR